MNIVTQKQPPLVISAARSAPNDEKYKENISKTPGWNSWWLSRQPLFETAKIPSGSRNAIVSNNNIYTLVDYAAPLVELTKEEVMYSLKNVTDLGKSISTGTMTYCFATSHKRDFFYGNDKGQIHKFSIESKRDQLIHDSSHFNTRVTEIKMLWVTKLDALWFIQANQVYIRPNMQVNDRANFYTDLPTRSICLCQDDKMIYISHANNEYSKFCINEETNKFQDISTIDMSKEAKEQLLNVELQDVVNIMDNSKVLNVNTYTKAVQRRISAKFRGVRQNYHFKSEPLGIVRLKTRKQKSLHIHL